jgi:hypothetical protein
MPRKQRFKPSRKPKPSPQAEATTIGHGNSATVGNQSPERAPQAREDEGDERDDGDPTASEADQRSR